MTKTIAIANQKGGVGKTSLAINVAAALAERGQRVLLIDLDHQCNSTAGVGVDPTANGNSRTVYDLFLGSKLETAEVIHPTSIQNLDLIPSSEYLAAAEMQLPQMVGAEKLLQEALSKVSGYDYVLLDCPPSLGRLTLNALTAATHVIIPVAVTGKWPLQGTRLLQDTIQLVRKRLNPSLAVLGVVCTFYDGRTVLSRDILAELVKQFGPLLFKTVIKRSTAVGESSVADAPVVLYARNSEVAAAYRDLSEEIERR
ncbi:MAG: ParA family protein [Deltaproteobacteria bacterium]|nr:ParA family protein [Deltaproteobacteria bacterium]MBI3388698.1 ParA family protein [Deltaproteobacteria bacterium]